MTMKKEELSRYKEQRAKIVHDMREINAPDMSEEAVAQFSKLEEEFNKISELVRREEKLLEAEASFNADKAELLKQDFNGKEEIEKASREAFGGDTRPLTEEELVEAQAAFFKYGQAEISDKAQSFAQRACLNISGNNFTAPLLDTGQYNKMRSSFAQSAIQGTLGGYTVPTTLNAGVELARLEHSQMRQVADVIRTESGGGLEWPTVDDTGNSAAIKGENAARDTQGVNFEKTTWYAYTLSSGFVKVPMELLQDSAVNLVAIISQILGERLARKEAALFTTGTGAGEPQGAVTGSVAGKTTSSSTAITINEVFDLEYSVGTYYRNRGLYMAHPNVFLALRKLVNGSGDYLWQPSVQAGVPDTFNGKRVIENQDMASSIATTNKTMLFGDFSNYKIREVGSIVMSRANERFIDNNQVAFIGHTRVDAGILNAGKDPIKHMVQV